MIKGLKTVLKMIFDFSGVPFEFWYSSFIMILFIVHLNISQPSPNAGVAIALIIMSVFFFVAGLVKEWKGNE